MLLQTQEVGPPFLLQSCPPKSLPFILTEPLTEFLPHRGACGVSRGAVSPGCVSPRLLTSPSPAPGDCPDLIPHRGTRDNISHILPSDS